MARTLVGLFEDELAAQAAADDLTRHGFAEDDISIVTNEVDDSGRVGQIATEGQHPISGNLPGGPEAGIAAALFQAGISEGDAAYYAEAVSHGGALVTVNCDDAGRDKVEPIFERNNSVDIHDRVDYDREDELEDEGDELLDEEIPGRDPSARGEVY